MKNILTLTFLLALSVLTSCGQISSEDISSQVVRTKYSATYNQDTKRLEVDGRFMLNNATYVTLDGESGLTVNGNATRYKRDLIGQVTYEYVKSNVSRSALSDYNLVYTNTEGSKYRNTLTIPSAIAVSIDTHVEASQDLVIDFELADPSDEATEMEARISYNEGSFERSVDAGLARGQFRFSAQDLNILQGQIVTVRVCREKYSSTLDHPGAGGYLNSRNCTRSYEVLIK
jgi:hypothetical protein